MNCYTIGLTGGIASGKTAVSNRFQDLGCAVIDADVIARVVVAPQSAGLQQLVKTFGNNILTPDKSLDRAKLKRFVFNDAEKLARLNTILHPLIKQKIVAEVKEVTNSFCIIVIPLLCESTSYDWLDRVLVVDVKPETQRKRLLTRDNISKELANKIITSQCTRKQRLEIADDVINNEQSLSQLHKNIESLYRMYKSL